MHQNPPGSLGNEVTAFPRPYRWIEGWVEGPGEEEGIEGKERGV